MEFIEQWFHTDSVPCQKQSSAFFLPNRERKNAVDMFQTIRSVFRIRMQNNLCIRMRLKMMTGVEQCPTQLFRIINLAVVNYDVMFPGKGEFHGLPSAIRIYD